MAKWLPGAAAGAGRRAPTARRRKQAQPQPFSLPPAGWPGEGQHLHPGQEFAGHGHEFAPDLILVKALQGQIAQAGVLRAANPVLAPRPAPAAQFQVRKLPPHMKRPGQVFADPEPGSCWFRTFGAGFCAGFGSMAVWAHALIAAPVVRSAARVKGARSARLGDAAGALDAGRREPMIGAVRA
jgi:hypothetical protein